METTGRVEAIWLKRAHRGPMDARDEAELVEGAGVAGSVGRSRRRQITIIEREVWERLMAEVGANADPSRRRANVMVSGIALARTRGRILRIGDIRVAVGGETTPCERMEEVAPGLQNAMRPDWGGGVFGQIITGGTIHVGDAVRWDDD